MGEDSTNSLYLNGFGLLTFNIKDKSVSYRNFQKNPKKAIITSTSKKTTYENIPGDWWIVKENDTYSIIEKPSNLIIDTLKNIEAGPFLNIEIAKEMLNILNSFKKED